MRELTRGRVIARRYRLERQLGRGGMGSVWLAFDTLSDETIALKLLSEPLSEDPGVRGRLLRELKAGRRVTHPNVCRVHDLGRHGGRLFVTMEYVEGCDLHDYLVDQRGSLTLAERFGLCIDIASALEAIHAAGIVHRDLKPANVLVSHDGKVRVTDFGLSRVMESGSKLDLSGPFIGTPGYMSPEQLLGEDIDRRSDIHSFAVLAFEVFTGKPLFTGTPGARLLGSITHDIDLTRESWWDLPDQVASVLTPCLERDRTRRPVDATALVKDLREAAEAVASELQTAGVPDLSAADRAETGLRAFRCPATGVVPRDTLTFGLARPWAVDPHYFDKRVRGIGWIHLPFWMNPPPEFLRDHWFRDVGLAVNLPDRNLARIATEVARALRGFDAGQLTRVNLLRKSDGSLTPDDAAAVTSLTEAVRDLDAPVIGFAVRADRHFMDAIARGADRCRAQYYSGSASDRMVEALVTWPNLWSIALTIDETDLSSAGWNLLGNITRLQRLRVWPSRPLAPTTCRMPGGALERLSGLIELHTRCVQPDARFLQALFELRSLEELHVHWGIDWSAEKFLSLPVLSRLRGLSFNRHLVSTSRTEWAGPDPPADPDFVGRLLARLERCRSLDIEMDGPCLPLLLARLQQFEDLWITFRSEPDLTHVRALVDAVKASTKLRVLDVRSARGWKLTAAVYGCFDELEHKEHFQLYT